MINQGHGTATARTVQICPDDEINDRAVLAILKAVIANNRSGGWRRLRG